MTTRGDDDLGRAEQREPQSRRHAALLRLDPAVHAALAQWAADELRSVNAQTELIIRRALDDAGRLPAGVRRLPRPGRPPTDSI